MDVESADTTVADALNGETKPDPAKLAQRAILKQVSLVCTSVSPIPSPSISLGYMQEVITSRGCAYCGIYDNRR